MGSARILFLADSHLGIDQPANPRIARRRRGDDFMANYLQVLRYAVDSECDAVIHGGDVFHRSQVRPEVVQEAFVPLKRIADSGKPVFVVPGNHERSRIPHGMLAVHPRIHLFDKPRTYLTNLNGCRIAISGFGHARSVRSCFPDLVAQTRWRDTPGDVRLLCVHQSFEGATVGPGDFTFRNTSDVVRHGDVPSGFDAVLSGHIHRHQILRYGLQQHKLRTPVLYPGSIERTSFAERDESKGFLELEIETHLRGAPRVTSMFRILPAREMVTESVSADVPPDMLQSALERIVTTAPPNAIIRLQVTGPVASAQAKLLSASALRSLAGPAKTFEVRFMSSRQHTRRDRGIEKQR